MVACSLFAAAACATGQFGVPTTGLTGTVVRGPVTPVCTVNVPCSAPFSATFTVKSGSSTVTSFQSDIQGQFKVMLYPGAYTIVPAFDAPMMSPSSQLKTVTVGSTGLTTVALEFDTGIR